MDSAGDFNIAWVSGTFNGSGSSTQDGSGYGIYAQQYNSGGAPQGSEFRVNTYTMGNQGLLTAGPAIGEDSAGDFVIAWQSTGEDGSGYGVYAQRDGYTTPFVTTSSGSLSYSANSGSLKPVDANLSLSDGESSTLTSATVTISSGYVNGEDVLAFTNQNGITGNFTAASGTLLLTGTATVSQYQAALESVTYDDTQHDASTAARTVGFLISYLLFQQHCHAEHQSVGRRGRATGDYRSAPLNGRGRRRFRTHRYCRGRRLVRGSRLHRQCNRGDREQSGQQHAERTDHARCKSTAWPRSRT